MPLISVLMSTYKEPIKYVEQAVNSILKQSFTDFEYIIVVDNPPNTEVVNYLTNKSQKDKRIICHINDRNVGLPASLNYGIGIATGSYIARMDADDIADRKRLELELSFLVDNQYDLISCNYQMFSDDGNLNVSIVHPETYKDCKKVIRKHSCLCHPGWLARKEVFTLLNGYREIYSCEDYDFVLRAVLNGFKIGNVQEELIYYRINPDGISQTNGIKQKLLTIYLARFYRQGKSPTIEEIEDYMVSEDYQKQFMNEVNLIENKAKYRTSQHTRDKAKAFIKILLDKWFWYEHFNK